MTHPLAIKCPTCGKTGTWFAGACGPFCSPRCRLIDLGKWLSGEQVISEPLRPETSEQLPDAPGRASVEQRQPC